MGNSKCLVINNTDHHIITIKECNLMYCKTSNSRVPYTGATKNLEPQKHASFCPSELKKNWRKKQKLMGTSTEIRISFKDSDSNEEVVLSLKDFERNAGIVLKDDNNRLVRVDVSREEAKKDKETSWFWEHEKKLKRHLISIADEKIRRSINQPQQEES